MQKYERIFVVVMDSLGVGEMPDSPDFGDVGVNTLGHISETQVSLNSADIGLPQLAMHSPYETAGVKDVEHISKEEAIERAKDRVPSGMTEGVPDDIYPESYIVTIEDLSMANQIAQEIRALDGVGEEKDDVLVNENSNLISKLAISAKVLAVTIFIVTSVGSCYVMMNSIKLMLYARRREISIMKYVGATDTFTKAPFVIEGLIIGLVSALIVILMTAWFCNGFANLANEVAFLSFLTTLSDIVPTVALILILLGVGTGSIGSSMSINKYLEV